MANGEFYDHDRIMENLRSGGHRFRTRSDSEIALHLYEDSATGALEQLRGEFAFVIWDEANQQLFAARDRFGIKPLYYCLHEGTLLIASEIKAILAAGVPARWNLDAVYHSGNACTAMPSWTFFDGIYSLPAGHYMISRRGHVETNRYWDFDYPRVDGGVGGLSESDYVTGFREQFDEAVRLRLRADVPVSCYLSGGLDSCATLGFMAQHCRQPVTAFNLTFEHAAYDESQLAKEMARTVGADYVPVPITQRQIAENFSDAIWHSETAFANGHGVAKFLLSRAVNEAGCKVVFTGEGADEVLAGYPHFRQDMLQYGNASGSPAELRERLERLGKNNPVSQGLLLPDETTVRPTDTVKRMLGFVPTWMRAHASIGGKLFGLFTDAFRSEYAGVDGGFLFLSEFDIPRQLAGRAPLHQSQYAWAKSSLPNYILNVLGDRMEMAHSVEGRVPFLDHKLVEFLRGVPVDLLIKGDSEKYLLKEAARPLIVRSVYERQKHPFLAPPAATSPLEPLYELTQDTLRGAVVAQLPFLDARRIIERLDLLSDMSDAQKVGYDPMLMALLKFLSAPRAVRHDLLTANVQGWWRRNTLYAWRKSC